LTAQVEIPSEVLSPGPWGERIQVIDYDGPAGVLHEPPKYAQMGTSGSVDRYANLPGAALLGDYGFHGQNVYAIAARILARFEKALGRRVPWSFQGHQLKIAPHAFEDANAFYSREDEGIFCGYFKTGDGRTVHSCLSHDIVAHETTHALLDGLRERYTDPSSPDQAGFHEGFADAVALLSVFALEPVIRKMLSLNDVNPDGTVLRKDFEIEKLRESALFVVAGQFGGALSGIPGRGLRRSAELKPITGLAGSAEFMEAHRRGELLVAAMLTAFIRVWSARALQLFEDQQHRLQLDRVVREGMHVADVLLTMAIRAIDYCPPMHIEYGDFLSAMLTADHEIRPDDSDYHLRRHLRGTFGAFGFRPASTLRQPEPGLWKRTDCESPGNKLDFSRCHFEPMQNDPTEVARFVWENRHPLKLHEVAFTRVLSVSPCWRIGADGFHLRETVAQYIQVLLLKAHELPEMQIEPPATMAPDTNVTLHGGGTLIFDEYGQLKYHIHNRVDRPDTQQKRIDYLFKQGYYFQAQAALRPFAQMHRARALGAHLRTAEGWY